MTQNPDLKLVKRSLDGEEEAFGELVRKYEKAVYNLVRRIIRDRSDAEDVFQEVFMNAYRHLEKYDPKYKFSSWLLSIAKNQALYRLRGKKAGANPVEDVDLAAAASNMAEARGSGQPVDPHERATRSETRNAILSCLHELPDRYRIVLVLRHLMHRSYQDIADIVDMKLGTVKTNIFLGRRLLRELLLEKQIHA